MRLHLSITRWSIDAVKAAFGQPKAETEPLPDLRTITYSPDPVSKRTSSSELLPTLPLLPNQDKADDDFIELQRICEAIGVDVNEVTGEGASPTTPRESSRDLSLDLNGEVSDDVLKLIQQVEATNTPRSAFRPNVQEHPEPASPPFGSARVQPLKPANTESAPAPLIRASELADVLASLKLRLLKIRLAPDDMDEAQAEIATSFAQLLSPRPKPQIIRVSLQALLSVLESAGPAALTKDIEASLIKVRAFLSHLDV